MNVPSFPVDVPKEVPFSRTVTPGNGIPELSMTVPFTEKVCCCETAYEAAGMIHNINDDKIMIINLRLCAKLKRFLNFFITL